MRTLPVTGLVDDVIGRAAYMNRAALHAFLREGPLFSGAALLVVYNAARVSLSERSCELAPMARLFQEA